MPSPYDDAALAKAIQQSIEHHRRLKIPMDPEALGRSIARSLKPRMVRTSGAISTPEGPVVVTHYEVAAVVETDR